MTSEVYDKINEIFLNILKTKQRDSVNYRLAGGEPLLMFNNWKEPISTFLEQTGPDIYVSILTNLTYLTDEMLEYFKDKRVSFCVSLDGYSYSKPFHNGMSSADTVKDNVDKLLAINKHISISTVVDKHSFNDIEKLAAWVAARNLTWEINLDHFLRDEMDFNTVVSKMFEVVDLLIIKKYDILRKFKFGNISFTSNYEGCQAGKSLIAIDVNGDVFPCQTTLYQEPICNIFTTDNLIKDLSDQNIYKLGEKYEAPDVCQKCSLFRLCGGGCKANNKGDNCNGACDILKTVIYYILKNSLDEQD